MELYIDVRSDVLYVYFKAIGGSSNQKFHAVILGSKYFIEYEFKQK